MKSRGRTLNTIVIVDFMGSGFGETTPEMEVKQHIDRYSELLSPCKLKWERKMCADFPPGTDLVIYDFGGMMPGATDLVASNARSLIRWAQDNPSSLAIVASSFTYQNSIVYEMEDLGLTLPNIICDDGSQEAEDKILAWLGIEKSSPPPRLTKLVTPTIGILGMELPSLKFFEPTPAFFGCMHKLKHLSVYDVGAGCGHVGQALREQGLDVTALDTCRREAQVGVLIDDGTTYDYPKDCVVMLCRPCHGYFPNGVLERAVECDVRVVVYVGKPKNASADLGRFRKMFRRTAQRVGKEQEGFYCWIRRP